MAQPDFTSPPTLRVTAPKPKMTVYYGLLIIALICMLMACLFLYLEIRRFGGFGTVPQRITMLDQSDLFVNHGGTAKRQFVIGNLSFEIGHIGNGQMTNDKFATTNLHCILRV
jgi:hypothetical protein